MTVFRTFSKLQVSRIFCVNRGTIYNWERNGLPVQQAGRFGRPAKLDFEAVLDWYLCREEAYGVSGEGLKILEDGIRERKKKLFGS